jgi:hypothetical protein
MMFYYQCKLEKDTPDGIVMETAWIEAKGAKEGNRVELIGEEGLWDVKMVCQPPMKKVDIHNHKAASGLKSIHFAR